ncbi:unnamed protein product [Vicia faba]|uniref:Glycylpeptide N-tetradecanoyltransferase n=1 Tax=Vicia faba TaxID=3906 RepID=A0AAV1A7Z6_VICFA|nr:unnamed protein product [Vicia faba]
MVDSNASSGSPEETQNQIPDGNVLAESDLALDNLAQKVQESLTLDQRHKFWETQLVGQFKDIGNSALPEGPIEPSTPLSEVKQEPYNLPNLYEWVTCDIHDEQMCDEIYTLLANNYVEDDENMFRFNYSKEFLRWALQPPGYFTSWHIGVRVKTSKKMVAFITGVPARIRVRDEVVSMAEINFLCVHKKLRTKRLAPVMIKEVTRRVHLENIWQAAYTAGVILPTPVSTCQYWHRSLNPKKLIDVGFSRLGARMTMSRTIKLYKLPESTVTPGFRKMEIHFLNSPQPLSYSTHHHNSRSSSSITASPSSNLISKPQSVYSLFHIHCQQHRKSSFGYPRALVSCLYNRVVSNNQPQIAFDFSKLRYYSLPFTLVSIDVIYVKMKDIVI